MTATHLTTILVSLIGTLGAIISPIIKSKDDNRKSTPELIQQTNKTVNDINSSINCRTRPLRKDIDDIKEQLEHLNNLILTYMTHKAIKNDVN
jgi:hypothetical protein